MTGASGVIYGIKMLQHLKQQMVETHLVISDAAKRNIEIETAYQADAVAEMADYAYRPDDYTSPLASGSFLTDGMVIIPCTIKTLSGIAHSFTDNLMTRAADVTLKEKRKLVLVVRETPLHQGHLKIMGMAAEMGAHILPPIPAFYHQPKTIDDLIHHTIGKIFDYFNITHQLFKRWGSFNS